MVNAPLTAIDAAAIDQRLLRTTFGCFPSGVTAVCGLASVDGAGAGQGRDSLNGASRNGASRNGASISTSRGSASRDGSASAALDRPAGPPSTGLADAPHLAGRVPVGMAVSSFTSVSLDPPLVSVCVANSSTTWPRLRMLDRLGVSVLGESHDLAARQLSAKSGDRFAGVELTSTARGALFIAGSAATLECELVSELPAGDHLIALLRIHALDSDASVTPLVFHGSRFRQLASI